MENVSVSLSCCAEILPTWPMVLLWAFIFLFTKMFAASIWRKSFILFTLDASLFGSASCFTLPNFDIKLILRVMLLHFPLDLYFLAATCDQDPFFTRNQLITNALVIPFHLNPTLNIPITKISSITFFVLFLNFNYTSKSHWISSFIN